MIRIEGNQRHGQGFQLHMMDGPADKLFDKYPLDFYSAVSCARELLEMVNREQGTSYEIGKVLQVSAGDLETSGKGDFGAARILHDIKSEKFELSTPAGPDVQTDVVAGKEEYILSGRGVVLFCFSSWKKDKNQKARASLQRYCEYICAHGHKGGATKALLELDRLPWAEAVLWIKRTYARHIHDDAALIRYVLER